MNKTFITNSFFTLLFLIFTHQTFAQCLTGGRYYEKQFQVKNTFNIPFGSAVKHDGTAQTLMMNIYEPANDTLFDGNRPLLVFAFGGSFTSGFRLSPDIVKLCNEFAQRGYVTVSIDYRLGFDTGTDSDTNQFKALIRGVQDMKAAVRYFYKNAQEGNTYRVDTNKIFIGGVSAGAFIALNYAYGKTDTLSFPAPGFAFPVLEELGGTEGNSGNPGYSTKVSGVIDLCGAIADTVWLMPSDIPLCGVHGTNDDLVRCVFDSAHAAHTTESRLFGGCDIKQRLSNIQSSRSSFYLFEGAGHVPFVLPCVLEPPCSYYMDTTVWVIRDFLYNQLCFQPLSVENTSVENLLISVYPNPSQDIITFSSQQETVLQLSLFGTDGRLVMQRTIAPNTKLTISKDETSGAGYYLYNVTNPKNPENRSVGRIVFF